MIKLRLAVVVTHPIQYNSPLFALITKRDNIDLKVFYTWGEDVLRDKFDPGFGKVIKWDIPLLEGYEYKFEKNIATDKGSHHNKGIINPDLISDIESWKANAILVIGWNFDSHYKAMRFFSGKIPVYFRGDSTLLDEQPGISLKNILRKIALRWVYKHVDKAFYVGTNNEKYYRKFGLKDNQLIYAPHAVDNDRFGDDTALYEQQALKWRKNLNIANSDIVFLFAGKLEPKKDPLLLINAFNTLQKVDAHLIIVGNGVLENIVRDMTNGNTNIHFMPFQNQSQMPGVFRICDVYILPSKGPGETWGLAINEAMASSRAVVASDKCGGAVDLIINDENGYIFKSGNGKSLEDVILKIYNMNKDKLNMMGRRSLEIIEGFSYTAIANAIEKELLNLNK